MAAVDVRRLVMVQENGVSVVPDYQAVAGEATFPWSWGYLISMAGVRYYVFLDGPEDPAAPVPAPQIGVEAEVQGEV